jgi:hypothetical protein
VTAQSYLLAYRAWLQNGKPGLAPSAALHGVDVSDHTLDLCAIDEEERAASGLSSWQFYDPKHYADLLRRRREAHAAVSRGVLDT